MRCIDSLLDHGRHLCSHFVFIRIGGISALLLHLLLFLIRDFVDFLIVRVVDPAFASFELSGVLHFYETLLDLLLDMLCEWHNVEAAEASRAEHFLMRRLLAHENALKDLFTVDLATAVEFLTHNDLDRYTHLVDHFE